MESILGRLNWLYNQALENRRTAYAYGKRKQSLSFYDQCKWLTKLRAANEHGLGEIAVGAGRGVLKRIDLAFQAFSRRGRAKIRCSRDTGPQHQFTETFWVTETLRSERTVTVSCEAIGSRCRESGLTPGWNLRRRQGRLGNVWQFDEVFNPSRTERRYL